MITNVKGISHTLSPHQLREVADCLRDSSGLATLATRWEYDSETSLLEETARVLGLSWLDSDELDVDPAALDGFPLKLIHRYDVFPLEKTDQWLRLAVSNPFAFDAFDTVATAVSREVRPVVTTPETVRDLIKRNLGV